MALGGLKKQKRDPRRFKLGWLMQGPFPELPDEYELPTLRVLDQGSTDACTAHAIAVISEIQEGVPLSPEWQFKRTKEIEGDFKSWGASADDAAKAATKGGLEQAQSPYRFGNEERNLIANPANWDRKLDAFALKHAKGSYFEIKPFGGFDLFDSIRHALWRYREERQGVVAGVMWSDGWSGPIIYSPGIPSFGHMVAVIGWRLLYGKPHLTIQNSGGDRLGDQGRQYFPRRVINEAFGSKWGLLMFVDEDSDVVKEKHWSIWQKILNAIAKLLHKFEIRAK